MNDDRPDELHRLLTTSEAIESLYTLFAAEEALDEVLLRVAQTASGAIAGADAVSITVLDDAGARTAAYTDERVLRLDHEQYLTGKGPCLDAAKTRRPVRATMNDQHWPSFVAAARAEGVLASLSAPLILTPADSSAQGELVGSLNIYSRSASAFDPFDEELMRLYTVTASNAITNARHWQHSRDTVAQLETALVSRSDIDQAKGVLRERTGCTADQAFAALVELSQHYNIKLRDVAHQLLEKDDES